jgi:hypothetical protein
MKTFYTLLLALPLCFNNVRAQSNLNSNLTAKATIYLDFDGETINSPMWNAGNNFTAASSGLSAAAIQEIYERVAEDFRPFNVNVTTSETVFRSAPFTQRIRVVITTTSSWFAGVGGVAFLGSFTWGDDTPCFVFSDRLGMFPKYVAECCSHETGHTLGLSHQSKYDAGCTLTATYHEGAGLGESSWAPIMGNSYYRNMSGWNNGPTPSGCTSNQDNLGIITGQNGFGFRADDYPDDLNSNPALLDVTAFSVNGIVSTSSDKDCFRFSLAENSNVLLNINPYHIGGNADGANLDVKLSLFNAAKTLIRVYDRTEQLSVSIDTVLQSGVYYLMIEGTGNQNVSDYGSLGAYSIEGIARILPIRSVTLSGSMVNNQVKLNWETISDNPITKTVIEYSENGQGFATWMEAEAPATNYTGSNPITGRQGFFRLKVVGTDNRWKYSNVLQLQGSRSSTARFTIASNGKDQFSVTGGSNYGISVYNTSGALLWKASGLSGRQAIDLSRQTNGIYLILLAEGSLRQTEKIYLNR